MKTTSTVLSSSSSSSMGIPLTTSNCVVTTAQQPPPSTKPSSCRCNGDDGVIASSDDNNKNNKSKHMDMVEIIGQDDAASSFSSFVDTGTTLPNNDTTTKNQSQQQPLQHQQPRFSTGITSVQNVMGAVPSSTLTPPVSLSSLSYLQTSTTTVATSAEARTIPTTRTKAGMERLVEQHRRPGRQVVWYRPPQQRPPRPRFETTTLSTILVSETNLASFSSFQRHDTTTATTTTTSSSLFGLPPFLDNYTTNHDDDQWIQVSSSSSLLTTARDVAMLVAFDVLRVFVINKTLQVWIKQRLLYFWQQHQRPFYNSNHKLTMMSSAYDAHRHQQQQDGRHRSSSHRPRLLLPALLQDDVIVRGLSNYGQTCFLNSVLQALTSLQPFMIYLERIVVVVHAAKQRNEQHQETTITTSTTTTITTSRSAADDDVGCLSETLWFLLASLQHETIAPVDPRKVLRHVAKRHKQFAGRHHSLLYHRHHHHEQQDAQELLQALLDVIISDAQLDKTSSSSSSAGSSLETFLLQRHCRHPAENERDEDWMSLSSFLTRISQEQEQQQHQHQQQSQQQTSGTCQDEHIAPPDIVANGYHLSDKDVNKQQVRDQAFLEEKKQEDFEQQHVNGRIRGAPPSLSESAVPTETYPVDVQAPPTKKHNDNDASTLSTLSDSWIIPLDDDWDDDSNIAAATMATSDLSTTTRLMLQTLSPITPSPMSGWLGSTLQCCNCHHVRPIQNAPFLDIPIVPTSINSHSMRCGFPSKQQMASSSSCSLAECLDAFTSVERVHDVECRNCTLQDEMAQLQEEIFMLQGAITTVLARTKSQSEDAVEGLQSELARAEGKLAIVKQIDPDQDDDDDDDNGGLQSVVASMNEIDFQVLQNVDADDDEALAKACRRKPLKRCDANKCLLFTRLPNVLCLHVQRRYYDPITDRMAKTSQHVDFPEILDLSLYCAYGGGRRGMPSWVGRGGSMTTTRSSDNIDTGMSRKRVIPCKLYKVMSVIEHRGNAHGGHYLTYRRVCVTGKRDQWVRISDQHVMPIHWNDVRKCEAYMLFYEAI